MPDIFITFLASFLIFALFFGLIILWFIDGNIKKEQVIHAVLASFTAWLIASGIKEIFPTVRPFLKDGGEILTLTTPNDAAFPSEHTTLAFAIAVTIFMHDKRIGYIFLVFAIAVGFSRVLANVHYPMDIVGGAFLGTFVSVLIERTHLYKLFKNR